MEDIKLLLLQKPMWTNADIQSYFGVGATKAVKIRQEAIKSNGLNKLMPKQVKRDAVFKVLGINVDYELANIRKVKELE